MTIDDGYAIQRAWVQLELADGRSVKGRKIGLTSRAMQQASQIDEPDYAPLMDDMFFDAGGDIPFDRFIAPRVEVELAFVLGKPLQGPGVTLVRRARRDRLRDAGGRDHRRAHRAVRPRRRRRRARSSTRSPTSPPTPASSPAAARCGRRRRPALGRRAALQERRRSRRPAWPPACSNHPATGVAWLANKIAPYDEQLNAGDVVLGGSFTRPTTARARRQLPRRLRAARRRSSSASPEHVRSQRDVVPRRASRPPPTREPLHAK